LKIGETSIVTITFLEAVTGFSNADLSIANGTLTTVSSSNGGISWTATFTPDANIEVATNVITIDNTGYADFAGNSGLGTTNSLNYAIDTKRPTVIGITTPGNRTVLRRGKIGRTGGTSSALIISSSSAESNGMNSVSSSITFERCKSAIFILLSIS